MKSYIRLFFFLILAVSVGTSVARVRNARTGTQMTVAAQHFAESLSSDQQKMTMLDYDSPQRVGWHFIPKPHRKGLQIKNMDQGQRELTHQLLQATLSAAGYDKSIEIMQLEEALAELQRLSGGGGPIRDSERYYVTIFGTPAADGRWGLSFEGHHLSLNFVIEEGEVISSSPQFLASNPAVLGRDYGDGLPKGLRVLAVEEEAAFGLMESLSEAQRNKSVLADQAPREIRAAGEPHSPATPPAGLPVAEMTAAQRTILKSLVDEYINLMPADVAAGRRQSIEKSGWEAVHFAWAGALHPGVGHYYRIQGPTFLVELVNTQPDAEGNPASHVHCVWRDPQGDFGIAR